MSATGPSIKRGKSDQDVETPADFIDALERRFGPIEFDLAADARTSKGRRGYIDKARDALTVDWCKAPGVQTLFCNPPYALITPWARKCAESARNPERQFRQLLLLVPAAVGSDWFAEWVHGHAGVLALSPRIQFVGHKHGYPRDLLLCIYGGARYFDTWRWRP